MKVFVVGASGVIGDRLVPQLVDGGHEVIGSARSPGKDGALARLRGRSGRARRARWAVRRAASASPAPTRSSTRPPLWPTFGSRGTSTQLCADQPAATGGRGRAPRGGARRACPSRRASPTTAMHGRGAWSRPRTTHSIRRRPASMRETSAAMTYLDDVVTAAGNRASLRRVLRRRERRAHPASAEAAVPDCRLGAASLFRPPR